MGLLVIFISILMTSLLIALGFVELPILLTVTNGLDASGRFALWEASGKVLSTASFQEIILGHGFIHTPDLLTPYVPEKHLGTGPHNVYIFLLIRFGLIGFLLYVYFLWIAPLKALRLKQSIYPVAATVGLSVYAFFEVPLFFTPGVTSILQGLVLGYLITNPLMKSFTAESI